MIEKYTSQGIVSLVAKGIVSIIGVWLLISAFIMRDIQASLFFMSIVLILYVMVVMLIYHKVFRAKECDSDKPWQRRNAVLWSRSEQSEQCIRLIIYKRPYGIIRWILIGKPMNRELQNKENRTKKLSCIPKPVKVTSAEDSLFPVVINDLSPLTSWLFVSVHHSFADLSMEPQCSKQQVPFRRFCRISSCKATKVFMALCLTGRFPQWYESV